MSVRYNTGGTGEYLFDACSKCGFAYATNFIDPTDEGEAVWEIILEHFSATLRDEGYPVTREGYHQWIMSLPEPTDNFGSVFVYEVERIAKGEGNAQ
jgi:hypothetical protein